MYVHVSIDNHVLIVLYLKLCFAVYLEMKYSHFCYVNLIQFSVCRDEDELLNTQCPQHLELRWQTEVSSSIYASPLIADINR